MAIFSQTFVRPYFIAHTFDRQDVILQGLVPLCSYILFIYVCVHITHFISVCLCLCCTVWLTDVWERLIDTQTDVYSARVRAASFCHIYANYYVGTQLKPHAFSVALPPGLIPLVTDGNVTGCYCFYVQCCCFWCRWWNSWKKNKTSAVYHTSAKACALSPCYTLVNFLHPTQQVKSLRIREKHR